VEELAEVVKLGLTRAVGVSNYNQAQMLRAYSVLSRHGIPLASNQVEYHLLNRAVERDGLLARCKELGVQLIAHSPLAKGLLTGKYRPENPPPGIRARHYASLTRIQPLLHLMTQIGRDQGSKTPAQVALNWIICPSHTSIIRYNTPYDAEPAPVPAQPQTCQVWIGSVRHAK